MGIDAQKKGFFECVACITPPKPSNIRKKNWGGKGEAIFDTSFMIQSHGESTKKIMRVIFGKGVAENG